MSETKNKVPELLEALKPARYISLQNIYSDDGKLLVPEGDEFDMRKLEKSLSPKKIKDLEGFILKYDDIDNDIDKKNGDINTNPEEGGFSIQQLLKQKSPAEVVETTRQYIQNLYTKGTRETMNTLHESSAMKILDSLARLEADNRLKPTEKETKIVTNFIKDFIKNLTKNQENNKINKEVIYILDVLAKRDEKTADHCLEVMVKTIEKGMNLGLKGMRLIQTGLSAMEHDIGKIIVEDIVKEKQSLTDEQFDILQLHPLLGYLTLSDFGTNVNNMNALVSGAHHELNTNPKKYGIFTFLNEFLGDNKISDTEKHKDSFIVKKEIYQRYIKPKEKEFKEILDYHNLILKVDNFVDFNRIIHLLQEDKKLLLAVKEIHTNKTLSERSLFFKAKSIYKELKDLIPASEFENILSKIHEPKLRHLSDAILNAEITKMSDVESAIMEARVYHPSKSLPTMMAILMREKNNYDKKVFAKSMESIINKNPTLFPKELIFSFESYTGIKADQGLNLPRDLEEKLIDTLTDDDLNVDHILNNLNSAEAVDAFLEETVDVCMEGDYPFFAKRDFPKELQAEMYDKHPNNITDSSIKEKIKNEFKKKIKGEFWMSIANEVDYRVKKTLVQKYPINNILEITNLVKYRDTLEKSKKFKFPFPEDSQKNAQLLEHSELIKTFDVLRQKFNNPKIKEYALKKWLLQRKNIAGIVTNELDKDVEAKDISSNDKVKGICKIVERKLFNKSPDEMINSIQGNVVIITREGNYPYSKENLLDHLDGKETIVFDETDQKGNFIQRITINQQLKPAQIMIYTPLLDNYQFDFANQILSNNNLG